MHLPPYHAVVADNYVRLSPLTHLSPYHAVVAVAIKWAWPLISPPPY